MEYVHQQGIFGTVSRSKKVWGDVYFLRAIPTTFAASRALGWTLDQGAHPVQSSSMVANAALALTR